MAQSNYEDLCTLFIWNHLLLLVPFLDSISPFLQVQILLRTSRNAAAYLNPFPVFLLKHFSRLLYYVRIFSFVLEFYVFYILLNRKQKMI